MKAESFDSLCSNGSRVVQLQVAPRGLRTAKVVKEESEASTAPAAISRRQRGKVTPCGLRLDGGVKAGSFDTLCSDRSRCRVLIAYLTTLAFGDPRGANYVRTTRDLSPLVLSSKENMFSLLPQVTPLTAVLVAPRFIGSYRSFAFTY